MDARCNEPAEQPDDENPLLTLAEIRRSRPAHEVLTELLGAKGAAEIVKQRRAVRRRRIAV